MFTIDIEVDDNCAYLDVILYYDNGNGVKFEFCPENTGAIANIIIGDEGSFDTDPNNGICSFHWCSKYIGFDLGKFGDGNGGSISIGLPNTPEVLQSLKDCLNRWKIENGKIQTKKEFNRDYYQCCN